jgi:hypothetical protein
MKVRFHYRHEDRAHLGLEKDNPSTRRADEWLSLWHRVRRYDLRLLDLKHRPLGYEKGSIELSAVESIVQR